jgi:hypothetical protein
MLGLAGQMRPAILHFRDFGIGRRGSSSPYSTLSFCAFCPAAPSPPAWALLLEEPIEVVGVQQHIRSESERMARRLR